MGSAFFSSALSVGKWKADIVVSFQLDLHVSRPPHAWVDVLVNDELDVDDLVGETASLGFGYIDDDQPRIFGGVIESVTSFGAADSEGTRLFNYRLHIVHPLAMMAWFEGNRIWQDLSVKDIIEKQLEECGLGADHVEMKLTETYLVRDFCVRYDESVLAFVNRLCEEEGIYYFWDLVGGKPKIVFADDSSNAPAIDGDEEVKFVEGGGLADQHDSVWRIFDRRREVSGKFTLRDFNLEKPKLDLTAHKDSDKNADLEVYDYPGIYADVGEGKRLAEVRLQAEQVERHLVDLEGDCARIHAGRKLKIAQSEHHDVSGEFFVVAVTHHMTRIAGEKGAGTLADESYVTTATVLPKKEKFRAPRITPKPIIEGPQTARVVCPSGAQSEEVHTDEYGRAKVKFHWDLGPAEDDKASAWFRVGQIQTSGSMMLPRLSWEVIMEFEEGDPDRPLVTGKFYNGAQMPPYALPEGKTRTSVQSASSPGGGGRNEIRFEDKAGGEEIMIHSQKDTTIKAANNKTKNVGKNETASVKVDRTLQVGADQEVKITKASQNSIGGNHSVSVGAVRKVECNAVTGLTTGGDASTSVGGMHYEMDGNPLEAIINIAISKAAEIAAEKAAEAAEHVKGAVMGKVNQVLGPVQGVVSKAQQLGGGMAALANGDLSGAGALVTGAAGLPGASAIAGGLGSKGGGGGGGGGLAPVQPGLAATTKAGPGGKGSSAGGIAAQNYLSGKLTDLVGEAVKGARKGAKKLAGGGGEGGGGGGGESEANEKGPKGDVDSVDGADNEKGPGHSATDVAGSINETVGALKVQGTVEGIMLNAKSFSETIGAARAEIVIGNRAESVEGMKKETSLGLIVLSKADETENVGGAKTAMVGGAVIDLVKQAHTISAGAPATFIGAFHKVEAKTKITLKCGGSSIVIDDSGITITSPIVTVTAAKIQLTDKVTEV